MIEMGQDEPARRCLPQFEQAPHQGHTVGAARHRDDDAHVAPCGGRPGVKQLGDEGRGFGQGTPALLLGASERDTRRGRNPRLGAMLAAFRLMINLVAVGEVFVRINMLYALLSAW